MPVLCAVTVTDTEIKPLIRLISSKQDVRHEVMLGLTSQPTKASGKQGLRSFPRGGALSTNFAAFPVFLKACAAFPSEVLRVVAVVLEMEGRNTG